MIPELSFPEFNFHYLSGLKSVYLKTFLMTEPDQTKVLNSVSPHHPRLKHLPKSAW